MDVFLLSCSGSGAGGRTSVVGGAGGGGKWNDWFGILHSGNSEEGLGGRGGRGGSSHCSWLYDCVNTVIDKIEIKTFQFF